MEVGTQDCHVCRVAPADAVRENLLHAPFLASGGLPAIFGIPGLLQSYPTSAFIFVYHSPCVCVCVQISPFYKDSRAGLGTQPIRLASA